MNRHVILALAVVAVLALLGFILWDVFRRLPPLPRTEEEPPPAAVPVEQAVPVRAPVERRQLAITGRVVGEALEALGAARVLCGEETVVTDSKGAFSFARASRPRTVTLRVFQGNSEIARWADVIAGDLATSSADSERPDDPSEPVITPYSLDGSMTPALPERIRWTINAPSAAPARAASENESSKAWNAADSALVEEWGNGVRVRLRGASKLPDGAHVGASLYFDGLRTIASLEPALVKGGSFEASMYSPADSRFFSGVFEARVSFNTLLESYAALEGWKQARPEVDWDSLTLPEVTRNIFAGDPLEAREEDLAAQAYYARMADSARRLERSLKSTLLSRSDEERIFVQGKGLSPKSRRDGPQSWFRADLLQSEGRLDEAKWRRFLDEGWRPELRALMEEHAGRGQEKYMTGSALLKGLLEALLEESYGYSRFVVYPAFNLQPHPDDFYIDEERAGDLIRLERIVISGFSGLERFQHLAE